jgi:hypothetical protein
VTLRKAEQPPLRRELRRLPERRRRQQDLTLRISRPDGECERQQKRDARKPLP